MPGKVFISHSSRDQAIADVVRQHLESAGIACWIAPRDIEPGTDWTEGIVCGIASSRILVDALLDNKEAAIAEAKHAVDLLPVSKDAVAGSYVEMNLAVVYAWTKELDLAFETLSSSSKAPNGIFYGQLKREPYWEPLRQDQRYQKLLAELAPRE